MEAEALRLLIRSKLNAGRLPHNSIPRFWGGPGNGEQCDACDSPITKEQFVMEGIASMHTDEKPIQFHVTCVGVWDGERLRIITPPRDSTFAADIARRLSLR
jgi:hypothetical protein